MLETSCGRIQVEAISWNSIGRHLRFINLSGAPLDVDLREIRIKGSEHDSLGFRVDIQGRMVRQGEAAFLVHGDRMMLIFGSEQDSDLLMASRLLSDGGRACLPDTLRFAFKEKKARMINWSR